MIRTATDDPNGLYSTDMGGNYGGIARDVGEGYRYVTFAGRGNMPVNYVSWYDTLRFANWMHNGKPAGAQDVSTTEDGAYDMSLRASVVRKPGALVFLTSEDEWFKAAYYMGNGIDVGYWDYPTQSDTVPTGEVPPGTDMTNGSANYNDARGDLTNVGSYDAKPSDSVYGTFDQGGNVWEWTEAVIDSFRVVRGGSFHRDGSFLEAADRRYHDPTDGTGYGGFRVAATCQFTDADGDGDIDLADFAVFQTCLCGPSE